MRTIYHLNDVGSDHQTARNLPQHRNLIETMTHTRSHIADEESSTCDKISPRTGKFYELKSEKINAIFQRHRNKFPTVKYKEEIQDYTGA